MPAFFSYTSEQQEDAKNKKKKADEEGVTVAASEAAEDGQPLPIYTQPQVHVFDSLPARPEDAPDFSRGETEGGSVVILGAAPSTTRSRFGAAALQAKPSKKKL